MRGKIIKLVKIKYIYIYTARNFIENISTYILFNTTAEYNQLINLSLNMHKMCGE